MTREEIEKTKQEILQKFREVGEVGLNKSSLNLKSPVKKEAFNEILKNRQIANIGGKKAVYVLKEFYRPLEIASEIIEKISFGQMKLFSRSFFEKQCPTGKIRNEANRAIELLVKEKKLLKFRYRNYYLYIHVSALSSVDIPTAPDEPIESKRPKIISAYEKLKRNTGFSNVEIYKLHQESGVPLDALKQFILDECRRGTAVLTTGDWSLSSEATRSGCIELDGIRYLLVRFLN